MSSTKTIIPQLLRQLKETINTLQKKPPENRPYHQEAHILLLLGLQKLVPQGNIKAAIHPTMGQDYWQPPPPGFLKFNTDGASKGKLGMVGYGRVIRDEKGNIVVIFHSHLGNATNNMVELLAIKKSLDILRDLNMSNTIIDVESELTINSIKKIKWLSTRESLKPLAAFAGLSMYSISSKNPVIPNCFSCAHKC